MGGSVQGEGVGVSLAGLLNLGDLMLPLGRQLSDWLKWQGALPANEHCFLGVWETPSPRWV